MEIPKKYVEKFNKIYGEKANLNELDKIYSRSLITPGEAVGVVAAQSIGEASTQMTLRTKHAAGLTSIHITSGLPRLIEIFDAKKEISTPVMSIKLKPETAKSKQKVLDFANAIIEIKVEDIVTVYNINMKRKAIEFTLDRDTMHDYGLTARDVGSKLKEMNVEFSLEGDTINVKSKTSDTLKKLMKLRNKISATTISGVPGIKRSVLNTSPDGTFWISTAGSNLDIILKKEEVDVKETTCNDIMETAKVLGIEAARNLIIEESNNTLQSVGLTVDLRHIFLIADAMCSEGEVRGIGRYGISGETESVFARAAFETPFKHLVDASLNHETDSFNFVADNIISNQVVPVGTGTVKLVYRHGRENKEETGGENKE
jgi:DNA-directed RNA polymerase subunit A"